MAGHCASCRGRPTFGILSDDWDSKTAARQLILDESVKPEAVDPEFDGSVLIYACRECGDVWCGGIAARITRLDDRIRWTEISKYWIDYGAANDGAENDQHFVFEATGIGPFDFRFQAIPVCAWELS
jgi:hypothetical protein